MQALCTLQPVIARRSGQAPANTCGDQALHPRLLIVTRASFRYNLRPSAGAVLSRGVRPSQFCKLT